MSKVKIAARRRILVILAVAFLGLAAGLLVTVFWPSFYASRELVVVRSR